MSYLVAFLVGVLIQASDLDRPMWRSSCLLLAMYGAAWVVTQW